MGRALVVMVVGLVGCSNGGETSAVEETVAATAVGRCSYVNPFSDAPECKEYLGSDWDDASAAEDCLTPVLAGDAGTFEAGLLCDRSAIVGTCTVDAGGPGEVVTVFPGSDPAACAGAELGCGFAGGTFEPDPVCDQPADVGVPPEDAFVPFAQVCVPPLEGSPPGASEGGLVCTWEAISGSTEEGRHFADYASCDAVFSQRPYYPYPVTIDAPSPDTRVDDPAWVVEFEWVTGQVASSACVCCHSSELAPDGPSGWHLESEGVWLDGVDDDALAMLAGWVDSTAFGAFPAEENNGFDRSVTGLPTTDVARMSAFLGGELARRGRTREDFVETPPFGGVLYDQLFYEPSACTGGEGVGADGVVTWSGGSARYVYVLEQGSMSPGVPPNLDTPDGTVWRLDVAHTAEPLASGVAYGSTPEGASQAWPTSGPAPALVSGRTYYLVALLDVYQPATRCLFVAP
jgi:hypothetical protein